MPICFHIRTILFAFRRGVGLPLPLHRLSPFPQPLKKNNTPSPRTTTLASLVKGEVLSPDKIRATTGGIATPPTSHRTNPSKTALSIENRHHPCLMNALFVLRPAKLRRSTSGIHARPLSKVRCCRPIKFGRRPEGLPHHQLCLAPTPPKPHYLTRFSYCNRLCVLIWFYF